MNRRRLITTLAASATIALAATGCGSSKSSSTASSRTNSTPAVTSTIPTASKRAHPAPKPARRPHRAPTPAASHPHSAGKRPASGGAAITGVKNRTKGKLRAVMGNGH